jgi:hypothetical protein
MQLGTQLVLGRQLLAMGQKQGQQLLLHLLKLQKGEIAFGLRLPPLVEQTLHIHRRKQTDAIVQIWRAAKALGHLLQATIGIRTGRTTLQNRRRHQGAKGLGSGPYLVAETGERGKIGWVRSTARISLIGSPASNLLGGKLVQSPTGDQVTAGSQLEQRLVAIQ